MRKFGLGRGLESLIPKRDNKLTPKLQDSVFYIELSKIVPNINQPRKAKSSLKTTQTTQN